MIEVLCATCNLPLQVKKGWYNYRINHGFKNFHHIQCKRKKQIWLFGAKNR